MAVKTEGKLEASRLYFFKDIVEKELAKALSTFGEKTKLRDACEYSLKSGGKRMRPLIVMMVADGLGHGLDVTEAALATEFFHTSSLIADDLPCMDNDDERRNQPTVHKEFGETVALLASYALITAGFEWITKNGKTMRLAPTPFSLVADRVCSVAVDHSARLAGISGATGGQFLDLFPTGDGYEMLKKTIYLKTVTLFEMSFLCGWLFGGGEVEKLAEVKAVAYHCGMAFQLADDLGDQKQDADKSCESNAALLLGKERAHALFEQEMARFKEGARDLGIWTPSFEKLMNLIKQ